jgi:hypothetical protein
MFDILTYDNIMNGWPMTLSRVGQYPYTVGTGTAVLNLTYTIVAIYDGEQTFRFTSEYDIENIIDLRFHADVGI